MKNEPSPEAVRELLEKLRSNFPADPWQEILEAFTITGVADNEHLLSVCACERLKLRRLLERLEEQCAGLPAILTRLPQAIRRTGKKGRPATIFRLGTSGAALLRQLGHPNAHPCGLTDETAITQPWRMVDIHLAARRAGVQVVTDRTIPYANGKHVLRPDHQARLPGRKTLLFEIEQAANAETLRRVLSSIARKRAFFESHESAGFERSVQVLFQTPTQTAWQKTLTTWARAAQMNEQETGRPLNFSLRAIPLPDFLENPDWHASDELRWQDLTAAAPADRPAAPAELIQCSARSDRLVVAALWQDLVENASQRLAPYPRPDPEFLRTMRLVYAASHSPDLPLMEQAAIPHASLYLLNHYMRLRGIDKPMRLALNKGRNSLRWNPTTILHRMQTVIDTFLGLHGWRSCGPLHATPVTADWNAADSHTFQVIVKIRDPRILQDEADPVPAEPEIRQTEQALAWVCRAFFAYSPELNLGSPEFW